MSCHGIEWHGRCIPIYREIDHWRGPGPDPEDRLFRDLGILATIHDGIGQLANEQLRKSLSEAVVGAARSMKLPDGMKLGDGLFKNEKAFMAAK